MVEEKVNRSKILITGATGAIGMEVLKQLTQLIPEEQIAIVARKSKKNLKKLARFGRIEKHFGDILDRNVLKQACSGAETVIHLAGIIPPESDKHPVQAMKVNAEGTNLLVKCIEEVAPSAFLLFSSSVAVYGDRIKNPIINVNDPVKENEYDIYANSKINAEEIIKNSRLNWSIFRLAAIMGLGNHKVSKIMFHVPLETKMEIATVRDTARAFVNAIDFKSPLNHRVFNLGGGESCHTTYEQFITKAFGAFGLGSVNFRPHSFAKANFHCGFYDDGHELEEIIKFRNDTLESYFLDLQASVHPLLRTITFIVKVPVKFYLGRLSEPRSAYISKDPEMMRRFFNETDNH